jgi:hypothetical protein
VIEMMRIFVVGVGDGVADGVGLTVGVGRAAESVGVGVPFGFAPTEFTEHPVRTSAAETRTPTATRRMTTPSLLKGMIPEAPDGKTKDIARPF